VTATKKGARLSPDESTEWLHSRMIQLGIKGLDELQRLSGVDKGSISRYFRQERNPGIDVVAPLCSALQVSPEALLIALGAIGRRPR
jgi:transcriptional regulator with XRE-family HTH domain